MHACYLPVTPVICAAQLPLLLDVLLGKTMLTLELPA